MQTSSFSSQTIHSAPPTPKTLPNTPKTEPSTPSTRPNTPGTPATPICAISPYRPRLANGFEVSVSPIHQVSAKLISAIMNNLEIAFESYNLNKFTFSSILNTSLTCKEWTYCCGTLNSPNFYIAPGKVYVEDGVISMQGGESRVNSVIEVNMLSAVPNIERVVKVSIKKELKAKNPYSPECHLIKKVKGRDRNSIKRLDAIIEKQVFMHGSKRCFLGLYERAVGDFCKVDLSNLNSMLSWCLDVAKGVNAMLIEGYVHSDINQNNLLYYGEGKVLKLSDFGCMKSIDAEPQNHTLSGTPFYFDPSNCLGWRGQVAFEGNQKHARSDIHAIGKLYLYFFLLGHLEKAAKLYSNVDQSISSSFESYKKKILPLQGVYNINDDSEKLDFLDAQGQMRIVFFKQSYNSEMVHTYEFLNLADTLALTKEAISLFENHLPQAELSKLKSTAELACKMQSREDAPRMNEVIECLCQIADDPKLVAVSPISATTLKRINSSDPYQGSPAIKKPRTINLIPKKRLDQELTIKGLPFDSMEIEF